MSKKWYSYFVSVETQPQPVNEVPSAAQTVAEIASRVSEPAPQFRTALPSAATFDEIYGAAEITAPAHGFTIFRVAELLDSAHVRSLPLEIKRSSLLLALEAAGVKLDDVIEDAVRRDRALDTFELIQQRALEQEEAEKSADNQRLQQEADRVLTELRAKMQANNDALGKARERFAQWRLAKQLEEQRIFDAVTPFVSENPISTAKRTS